MWGASPDCLPAWMKATDLNEFEVMADNVPAFRVFRIVKTQWRVNFGALVGLDYNPVFAVMGRMQIPDDEQLDCLERIGLIELGFMSVVNSK